MDANRSTAFSLGLQGKVTADLLHAVTELLKEERIWNSQSYHRVLLNE